MSPVLRRSNLLVPITNPSFVERAWLRRADAVTLDLEEAIPPERKAYARSLVREAIPLVSKGASEVFVRLNRDTVHADLEASVWPGLTGVTLPGAEDSGEVRTLDRLLGALERRRGIPKGTL
jgi:citrate lyase subunit beta/citryl-CoA lyase